MSMKVFVVAFKQIKTPICLCHNWLYASVFVRVRACARARARVCVCVCVCVCERERERGGGGEREETREVELTCRCDVQEDYGSRPSTYSSRLFPSSPPPYSREHYPKTTTPFFTPKSNNTPAVHEPLDSKPFPASSYTSHSVSGRFRWFLLEGTPFQFDCAGLCWSARFGYRVM